MNLVKLSRRRDDGSTVAVWVNLDFIATAEWQDAGYTRIELAGGTIIKVVEPPYEIAKACKALELVAA